MGFDYVPKMGRIFVVTLTNSGTWYEVLTAAQARGIRGFRVKSRVAYDSNGAPTHAPRPFDLAMSETPESGDSSGSGFISMSNAGASDVFGPVNGLWARSSVGGAVLEILVFD